jgi:hypothetical protein
VNDRILFLGTGGDTFTVGKQSRASGGIIIEAEGMQFHIDPGPGSLCMCKEFDINPRNTIALLVSGPNIHLCNDVNAMIDAMTHNGLDKRGVLVANSIVYNGDEERQSYITKHFKECVEKSIAVEVGKKIGINEVEIRTLPCHNTDNMGFKFFTSKFVLSYSSNTEYSSELIENYKGSDILILNVLTPADKKSPGFLCVDDAIKIANKVKPKMLILTGFGIKMLQTDILTETRRIQKETNIQTLAAKDGLQINPLSYNATMKQKTLKHF